MKLTTSAQVIAAAMLSLSAQVRSWEVSFYVDGNACGDNSTNYVNYEGTDHDCHLVGSADASCTGFSDGGFASNPALCGAPFQPRSSQTSGQNNPPAGGFCTLWTAPNCTGQHLNIDIGCEATDGQWQAFVC